MINCYAQLISVDESDDYWMRMQFYWNICCIIPMLTMNLPSCKHSFLVLLKVG